ncbi:hypothetical protein SAMN02745244_01941 [Tessaracoccus bendigoensis DSM 12906]|uniref:Uncharacterized protein n=1 Tax=Tessaracoccus bendigoensis DSM 12906 TaxID=1123357 RepID=A0A1M6HCX5_9ACTN|nr:hypothetical protein [Tessaracoccus bendigoensis]SHJ19939.1 hypothetical protein SAMN02745244_01941 [Tessaracoccus bendigoensis DSM 12906]
MEAQVPKDQSIVLPLPVLAEAVWVASLQQRMALHYGWSRCLTRNAPYGPNDRGGLDVHEWCTTVGCIDLHHELLSRVLAKLTRAGSASNATVKDPGAYAYRIATTELVEMGRCERAAQGFPVKPSRTDGAAGRINRELALLPEGEWLLVLFRVMRSYPFSPHHVPGRWPMAGFAEEKTFLDGGRVVPLEEVRRDVGLVIATAKATAGHAWVYSNLTLPLYTTGPAEALTPEHTVDRPDEVDGILMRLLRASYARHRSAGDDPQVAFHKAAVEVVGQEPPTETSEIRDALSDLDHELLLAS